MAQFDYASYAAQQAARRNAASNGPRADGPKIHYASEYLGEDGGTLIVRFPYRSMQDVTFESTHSVTLPGEKYPKRIRCSGDGCPLCAKGEKTQMRFFMKAVGYVETAPGTVELVPVVWDRPAAFADIDLKALMDEYGELPDSIFKIKRSGTGVNTRYTIMPITNRTLYPETIYRNDLSCIENVDPTRIFSKPIEKYLEAVGAAPAEAEEELSSTSTADVEVTKETAPAEKQTPSVESDVRKPNRYTF